MCFYDIKFAGKWMEQEKKIILSKATQTQKEKHDMYPLVSAYQLLNKGQSHYISQTQKGK